MTERTEKPEVLHHPDKTFPYETPHKGDGLADTHRRYHNIYGMQMARSAFEGVKKLVPERRPFVLTRAGFAGIQRYSAVWTGDNYASWDHLALTISMLANLSVSGVPFVGADVGGFNDRPSPELYARWLQAAALTPFFRSHSVAWAGNKEPWEFGDEVTAINRRTVELRYRFLPYIYTLFREHERTGEPVMRPLWYEFPEDLRTYLIADQYMVGGDVMVAPVVKDGMRQREVYPPVGAEWIDWWTGEKLESGKSHVIIAPLDRLPIFVRAGAVVPTQSVVQHTGEMSSAQITLNVIAGITPGITNVSSLFQDSGDGYGYRRADWSEIRFEHSSGKLKLTRFGNYVGQEIRFVEVHGLPADVREVKANGKTIRHNYDRDSKLLTLEIPDGTNEITLVR